MPRGYVLLILSRILVYFQFYPSCCSTISFCIFLPLNDLPTNSLMKVQRGFIFDSAPSLPTADVFARGFSSVASSRYVYEEQLFLGGSSRVFFFASVSLKLTLILLLLPFCLHNSFYVRGLD